MSAFFVLGLALTVVGGYAFGVSEIVGEIPRKWPFEPINRHDQPERFAFWRKVAGGALAIGVLLLVIFALRR